jgi:hypothetical protein
MLHNIFISICLLCITAQTAKEIEETSMLPTKPEYCGLSIFRNEIYGRSSVRSKEIYYLLTNFFVMLLLSEE